MYPRVSYEMTQEDLDAILEACKPTPVMFLSGGTPMGSSPQENANRAWQRLGEKMGFDHMTVQPITSEGMRFFTAVPNETPEAKKERLIREAEEKRQSLITEHTEAIAKHQAALNELNAE